MQYHANYCLPLQFVTKDIHYYCCHKKWIVLRQQFWLLSRLRNQFTVLRNLFLSYEPIVVDRIDFVPLQRWLGTSCGRGRPLFVLCPFRARSWPGLYPFQFWIGIWFSFEFLRTGVLTYAVINYGLSGVHCVLFRALPIFVSPCYGHLLLLPCDCPRSGLYKFHSQLHLKPASFGQG